MRCVRCPLLTSSSARWLPLVAVLFHCRVQWFGRAPTHFFIGSVVSIGGRFYSLAGFNGSGVSLVGGSFLAGVNGSGVSLGEMSGNDIAMSGGSIPLQVVNGSSARWAVHRSGGEMSGGVTYPLLHRLGGFHWWRFYSLAGVNGLGVSPLYCFPLQVRAVVAMVKFSHLTNFVLNKKLGCIIQNCALGGCPLSPASSARWLPLVAVLFPCRCQWFGRVPSLLLPIAGSGGGRNGQI